MPELARSTISQHQWRALSIFVLYRLIISASLAGVFQFQIGPEYLGASNPTLYVFASYGYLAFALICPLGVRLERPDHSLQITIQVSMDIVAITLIMFASGGISSGLGTLLAISVTSAGLMLGNSTALAFAAAATLALFGEQSIALVYTNRSQTAFTLSGIHGAVFFSTTLLAIMLGARVRLSEAMATKSHEQIERLRKLNEQVIHYMNTGLLVVDEAQNVILKNEAIDHLLTLPKNYDDGLSLEDLSSQLSLVFNNWLTAGEEPEEIAGADKNQALLPSFRIIEDSDQSLYLIFLEDTTTIQQHAQNLKLASLGRLTGSIAHEIRNPLGAASHAAQLLSESPDLVTADQQLVDMIQRHCKRMNNIIESIMATSQRKQADPSVFNLLTLIESFTQDFSINRDPKPIIETDFADPDLVVAFDPNHLVQILVNLCDNGIRYSLEHSQEAYIKLSAGLDSDSGRAFLDILDKGEGIPKDISDKLFEPFYTTSHGGTGLGLYLSRELCVANRAKMFLQPSNSGACFRILFYKLG